MGKTRSNIGVFGKALACGTMWVPELGSHLMSEPGYTLAMGGTDERLDGGVWQGHYSMQGTVQAVWYPIGLFD